jgi:hypothetical protein
LIEVTLIVYRLQPNSRGPKHPAERAFDIPGSQFGNIRTSKAIAVRTIIWDSIPLEDNMNDQDLEWAGASHPRHEFHKAEATQIEENARKQFPFGRFDITCDGNNWILRVKNQQGTRYEFAAATLEGLVALSENLTDNDCGRVNHPR